MYTPFSHLTTIHGLSPPPPPYNSQERNPFGFFQNRQDPVHNFFGVTRYNDNNNDNDDNDNNVCVEKLDHQMMKKKNVNLCTGKKDKHSKIITAAGLRDRRVRLSMDIARKFFDLQDMLGFDKASQTLDWLFTCSKDSINELVKMKMKMTRSINTNANDSNNNSNSNSNNNSATVEKICRDAFDMSSRESRAKARARARSRTMVKLVARRNQMMVNQDHNSLLRLMNGCDLPTTKTTSTTSPNYNHSSSSRSWPQIEPTHDIWDISIPPDPSLFNID